MTIAIPVMRPKLPSLSEVAPFITEMDTNRWYSNRGPLVERLESVLADYLGADPKNTVVMANATLAISGLASLLAPTRWVIPDFTFAATGHAILAASKQPTLADVSAITGRLDWQMVTSQLSGEQLGLVIVEPFGARPDFINIPTDLPVIIDAAASLGTARDVCRGIPRNVSVVFSLHATKVFAAGEGAVVVLSDPDLARRLRAWMNFGFEGNRVSRFPSVNAKLSEIVAAYGLASMASHEVEIHEWLEIQDFCLDLTKKFGLNAWHKEASANPYWVVVTGSVQEAQGIEQEFNRRLIQTRRWWTPLHLMPAFESLPRFGTLETSLSLSARTVGLPIWRGMGPSELGRISLALAGLHEPCSVDSSEAL